MSKLMYPTARDSVIAQERAISVFRLTATLKPALGPTQPPLQRYPGFFLRSKAAEAWSWSLIASYAEVKKARICTSTPLYFVWCGAQLSAGENFTRMAGMYYTNGSRKDGYTVLLENLMEVDR
jgi:hypothetical protein